MRALAPYPRARVPAGDLRLELASLVDEDGCIKRCCVAIYIAGGGRGRRGRRNGNRDEIRRVEHGCDA